METAELQKVIIERVKNKTFTTNKELAIELGLGVMLVSANYSSLKRNGEIPNDKKVNEKLNRLNKKLTTKYQNTKGKNKQIARDVMIHAIKNSEASKGTILTLPYKHCIIEKAILNKVSSRYNFMACEFDHKVYSKMLITIGNESLPMSTHRGGIGEKIEQANENEYSHLILDYCGQLGTYHKEIEMAIKNNIVEVDGTISITLNKRISEGTDAIYKQMELLNPTIIKSELTRVEHSLRTFINRIGGMNYAIETVLNYRDTTSMILMIVRRIN